MPVWVAVGGLTYITRWVIAWVTSHPPYLATQKPQKNTKTIPLRGGVRRRRGVVAAVVKATPVPVGREPARQAAPATPQTEGNFCG